MAQETVSIGSYFNTMDVDLTTIGFYRDEVKYVEGDTLPDGKAVGDVKTPASIRQYFMEGVDYQNGEVFRGNDSVTNEGKMFHQLGNDKVKVVLEHLGYGLLYQFKATGLNQVRTENGTEQTVEWEPEWKDKEQEIYKSTDLGSIWSSAEFDKGVDVYVRMPVGSSIGTDSLSYTQVKEQLSKQHIGTLSLIHI